MPNGKTADVDHAALGHAVEAAQQTVLLQAILAELRSGALDVGISDAAGQGMLLDSFPVAGAKRVIAYRTGNGFDALPVPAAPGVLVLPANQARIGMRIANSHATNAVILYLARIAQAGAPAVYLPAGQSWDGRLGNALWCGHVWGVGQGGASTVVGGEI